LPQRQKKEKKNENENEKEDPECIVFWMKKINPINIQPLNMQKIIPSIFP
jgi:hypothetical protein